MTAQVQHLAQQVADLQDELEARADAGSERVAALQATIERLSGEAERERDERTAELESKIGALEEQVCCFAAPAAHACTCPCP